MSCRSFLLACFLPGCPLLADDASLAPPPDVPASTPSAPTAVSNAVTAPAAQDADSQPTPSTELPILPAISKPADDSHDSLRPAAMRTIPEDPEATPFFLKRVEELRKNHDNFMAVSYLKQVMNSSPLSKRDRARCILELADCLGALHEDAEALCWLKVWLELYPGRPEVAAVSYRLASLYSEMGMTSLARDAYYSALSHCLDQGQVENADDLKQYTQLTVETLWGMAENEYRGGEWARAGKLFDRYRKEAQGAPPLSLERAAFLQADCAYQLRQLDQATALYTETLAQHPFNPLAPQARLRLYHLDLLQHQPEKAGQELQSLAWTVRTVFPKDEVYWQQQTAQLILALNKHNGDVLPPLVQQLQHLPAEGKTWQAALDHYDALVSYQAGLPPSNMAGPGTSPSPSGTRHGLIEDDELVAMSHSIGQLPAAPSNASSR